MLVDMETAAVSQDVRAAPAVSVGWALFDPCVVLGDAAPSSVAAVSKTLNGRDVRVSIRLAPPPAISYVHLCTDDYIDGWEPRVVSADGDLLLIYMAVHAEGGALSWRQFPDNFFVYKADLERPWLEGLPSLGDWMGQALHTGVARCGGGNQDFFVADLQPRLLFPSGAPGGDTEEVAELFRYSSATEQWELKWLHMPRDPEDGLRPLCWQTDAVFSFGGLMCWADYHRGIVFCDVAADDPELRFVQFPLPETYHDFRDGRGLPEMYRTASVRRGRLWFVDVDDGRFRRARSSTAGTITTWTLRIPELEWRKEHTLQFKELWSRREYRRSPLPRSLPGFPVIDMQEADVLHFIVQGGADSIKHWMITVDMGKRCLMSYELYQNAIEEPESDVDVKNMFSDEPLICCEVSGRS